MNRVRLFFPTVTLVEEGELSRVMLAIKRALAKTDPVPTYVFDEVDSVAFCATACCAHDYERIRRFGAPGHDSGGRMQVRLTYSVGLS